MRYSTRGYLGTVQLQSHTFVAQLTSLSAPLSANHHPAVLEENPKIIYNFLYV
eukprot:SAG11_NODE_30129_length_304_cov_0.463415_1_plen_52_part_10